MRSFTWEMACRRRLARHSLLEPLAQDRLVDAVRTISGFQAQLLSAAELAIGARVAGVTRRDVQAALWKEWQVQRLDMVDKSRSHPQASFRLFFMSKQSRLGI